MCIGLAKVILFGCYATLVVSSAIVYTGELLRGWEFFISSTTNYIFSNSLQYIFWTYLKIFISIPANYIFSNSLQYIFWTYLKPFISIPANYIFSNSLQYIFWTYLKFFISLPANYIFSNSLQIYSYPEMSGISTFQFSRTSSPHFYFWNS